MSGQEDSGSLKDYGVTYSQVELTEDGVIDDQSEKCNK